MERLLITGGTVAARGRLWEGRSVLLEDGVIADADFHGAYTGETFDATGCYVLPGLIDMHVHGGGGSDFMDATGEAFSAIARTHLRHGVTSLAPTTVACDLPALQRFFDAYRACPDRALFLGVHMEGPYLSQAMRGAQNPAYLRAPTARETAWLLDVAGDLLIRVSAAPELPGMDALAAALSRRGVCLAVAHSDATCETILRAFDQGFTHITHLYCSTPGVRKIGQRVCAGVVEAAYLLAGMSVELIGDGRHIPAELARLVVSLKGTGRTALITDAMRAAGTDARESYLGAVCPENRVIIEEGVAKLPDRSSFAGSVATGDQVLRNMVRFGISLPDAVDMMTQTPARILRVDKRKGAVETGRDADLLILDGGLAVRQVFTGGRPRLDGARRQGADASSQARR